MNIANKISGSFFITAIILTVVAASIFYGSAKRNLKNAIFAHLATTAKSRANHLETFIEEHKQTVKLMSSETLFIELLRTSKDDPEYNQKLEEVKTFAGKGNKIVKTAISTLILIFLPNRHKL